MPADRRIEIGPDEIESAVQRDSTHCMIAEAIKRSRPDWKSISVDLQTIRYTDRLGQRHIVLTPPVAQRALLWFDDGDKRLAPFTFKLPHAAQILPKKKQDETRRSRRREGVEVKARGTGQSAPVVKGGIAPPTAALAGGDKSGTRARMTGRIRRYGLRSMGR